MAEEDLKYSTRPSDPPKTQVPWLSHKKCFQEAQSSKVLKQPGQFDGHSEYTEEFVQKQTNPSAPVFLRDDKEPKDSRRCFPAAKAARGNDDCRKQGIRYFSAIRSSSMPWHPTATSATARNVKGMDDYSAAITPSPGLRRVPYAAQRVGADESARPRGLRSSPYCDKFTSTLF